MLAVIVTDDRAKNNRQKFSNYRIRLAIVGDLSKYTNKSVKDFIYESNKDRYINFIASQTEAIDILSGK